MRDYATNREAEILTILTNGPNYGRAIRAQIKKRLGVNVPYGTLYTTLNRMTDAGFLTATTIASGHRDGGYKRRSFKITARGHRALHKTIPRLAALVQGASDA